jgi:hypothetical protein
MTNKKYVLRSFPKFVYSGINNDFSEIHKHFLSLLLSVTVKRNFQLNLLFYLHMDTN